MCGIIGIQGSDKATPDVYEGLLLLQHRGQDAAGILSFDDHTKQFHLHKDKGLVGQVFDQKNLSFLQGQSAIGHTRYATLSTKNSFGPRDLQPMLVNYPHGLGLVHNGNIVNIEDLTRELSENHQRMMLTKNDAEILLNVLSTQIQDSISADPIEQLKCASQKVFDDAMGGYAIIALWANGHMIGMRDPYGLRPLVLGRKNSAGKTSHILASETNVIHYLGYEFVRDILPGELIVITQDGNLTSSRMKEEKQKAHCMFEWVYFATPESIMDGTSVYQARLNMGRKLGERIGQMLKDKEIEIDVVVPVPESGRIAAIALSESIGIPFRELLIKNRYIQRSFILQDQESRNRAVQLKLMAVTSELKDKRVLIVDDSIVRGTTSKRLVQTVRDAGAREVIFVSTAPPIKSPCFFGIDFPLKEELIAANLNEVELAQYLEADRVIYQNIEDLKEALNHSDLCLGCISGVYPFDLGDSAKKFELNRRNR